MSNNIKKIDETDYNPSATTKPRKNSIDNNEEQYDPHATMDEVGARNPEFPGGGFNRDEEIGDNRDKWLEFENRSKDEVSQPQLPSDDLANTRNAKSWEQNLQKIVGKSFRGTDTVQYMQQEVAERAAEREREDKSAVAQYFKKKNSERLMNTSISSMSWDDVHDLAELSKEHDDLTIRKQNGDPTEEGDPVKILRNIEKIADSDMTFITKRDQILQLVEQGLSVCGRTNRELAPHFEKIRNIISQTTPQEPIEPMQDTTKMLKIINKEISKCDAKKMLKIINKELRKREGIGINKVCELVAEDPIPELRKIAGDSIKIWDDGTWT